MKKVYITGRARGFLREWFDADSAQEFVIGGIPKECCHFGCNGTVTNVPDKIYKTAKGTYVGVWSGETNMLEDSAAKDILYLSGHTLPDGPEV